MSAATLQAYGLSLAESQTLENFDRALERLNLAVGPYAILKARAGVRGAFSRVEAMGLAHALTLNEWRIVRECQ